MSTRRQTAPTRRLWWHERGVPCGVAAEPSPLQGAVPHGSRRARLCGAPGFRTVSCPHASNAGARMVPHVLHGDEAAARRASLRLSGAAALHKQSIQHHGAGCSVLQTLWHASSAMLSFGLRCELIDRTRGLAVVLCHGSCTLQKVHYQTDVVTISKVADVSRIRGRQ